MPPVANYEVGQDTARRGTTLGVVLLQLKADLMAWAELAAGRVLIVADRKFDPRAISESHIRIRVLRRQGLDNPGAGRLANFKKRIVAVDIFVRDARDMAASDEIALTDGTTGLFALEDRVLDSLDQHTPQQFNQPLVYEPMNETTTDDPNRPQPGDGFCTETLYFQISYIPKLTIKRT